jgi:hypothetical protein
MTSESDDHNEQRPIVQQERWLPKQEGGCAGEVDGMFALWVRGINQLCHTHSDSSASVDELRHCPASVDELRHCPASVAHFNATCAIVG